MYKFFAYTILAILLLGANSYAATTHKVRKGETLSKIATAYKVTVTGIKNANNIRNANKIRIGQVLKIPGTAPRYVEYRIRNGDSLSKIAQRNRITLRQLTAANNIRNANKIRVGQVIKIPIRGSKAGSPPKYSAMASKSQKALKAIKPKANNWKHIVIHHSATPQGTAKGFDRVHREERNMTNGLAYHFLIGNGRGMGDGEIHIGDRWKRQIQGGHLSSFALNKISIGICLVGNFEKTKPTRKQLQQLDALVEYLMAVTNVPVSRVTTHTLIHPNHTDCPGKNFSLANFKRKLKKR